MSTKEPENVKAIYEGEVVSIVVMGDTDAGFGNTIILEHNVNNEIVYSMYAHLESINKDMGVGKKVKGGDVIGITGASGYGCQNY
jgi:murein DD-endopeptidase MepM/ murein hydrolase activator NlpD